MNVINRQKFLDTLNRVKAGLSPREFIEQSSCFVFQGGLVTTFNDELACRMKSGVGFEGAVQAASLLEILDKIPDEELEVLENEAGELEFRGKRRRFGVTRDKEIFLPLDRVEVPEKWRALPKEFLEAVSMVQHCVSTDESRFLLTCVHITATHVEACDNLQAMRVLAALPLKTPTLVRGTSLAHILDHAMNEIALTANWVHFRNAEGLMISSRRYAEDYPNLDNIMQVKGSEVELPKGLKEATECAGIFAKDKAGDPLVEVAIKEGRLSVAGRGLSGWYKEVRATTYVGSPINFLIAPSLLAMIVEKYDKATISKDKLKAESATWQYVSVLGTAGEKPASSKKGGKKESEEE